MSIQEVQNTVTVVGGGPAGMMLGYLLGRAGISVTVLEKHGDFLRDFRGDTVHPSTLELMHELGVLEEFLKLPHEKATTLEGQVGKDRVQVADFSYLPTKCKFVVFVPQWDFLDFMAVRAKRFPSFSLRMETEATDLIEENGKIVGVVAKDREGKESHFRSDLVVGADGRSSIIRSRAALQVQDVGAPMDVLWMRISRIAGDPPQSMGRLGAGSFFVMLNRGDYYQCGFLIPKGSLEKYREEGLEAFQQRILNCAPYLEERVKELSSWDLIKLLTVKVDWLPNWYRDGLICIGDCAHAMSPVGGVGVNLAIQDAVATANLLYQPLVNRNCTVDDLKKVQVRRSYPTRMTQRLQVAIQNNIIKPTLKGTAEPTVPGIVQALSAIPPFRGIPAHLIGLGLRPEHIHTPRKP